MLSLVMGLAGPRRGYAVRWDTLGRPGPATSGGRALLSYPGMGPRREPISVRRAKDAVL